MEKFEFKKYNGEIYQTIEYQFVGEYLQVENKKIKIKELKHGDLIYRLNKTCITTKSKEYLEKFINEQKETNVMTCFVRQIFEHILKVGSEI